MSPRRLLLIPRYRVAASPLAVATMYAAAGFGIGQGLLIIGSRPERFGSPLFSIMRHAPNAWGAAALIFGVLVWWGVRRNHFYMKALALLGLCAWSLVFATVSLIAYLNDENAAPTAPPAYYFIAIVMAILVWADTKDATNATSPRLR